MNYLIRTFISLLFLYVIYKAVKVLQYQINNEKFLNYSHNLQNAKLKIDFISIGAHKFYGPKGIGALYCKNGCILKPLISGGGQESGLRAGTENISFIAGMSLALEIANKKYHENKDNIISLEKYSYP